MKLVKFEKLEGLDRVEVARGDVLKLVHAALNQDRKMDPIYLRRTATGLLEKIEPTIRTEKQEADVTLEKLRAWGTLHNPFTKTDAIDSRERWCSLSKSGAKDFLDEAIASGDVVASEEQRKGRPLYTMKDAPEVPEDF
jgi:hypothetical protein